MEKLVFPKNEEKAKQMEDYMRNQFLFAGVPKPERAHMQKNCCLRVNTYLFQKLLLWLTIIMVKSKESISI